MKRKIYKPKSLKELENEESKNYFKIVLIGDTCTGKTNIFRSLTSGEPVFGVFPATIGIEKKTIILNMENGKEVNFSLFDTSGQEQYLPIVRYYYRGDAVILVYSIIDKRSFESLNVRINLLKQINCFEIPILLLGNKKDLEERRQVTEEQGEKFALEHGFIFHESTLTDYEELYSIFYKFTKIVYEKYLKEHNILGEHNLIEEHNKYNDQSSFNKKNFNILMKYISF